MKRNIIIISIIIIILIALIAIGYFRKIQVQKKPSGVVEVQKPPIALPLLPTGKEIPKSTTSQPTVISTPTSQISKSYQLLFDQPLLYIDLKYPLLYVYDYKTSIVKYLNLEDETYREIFKAFNLKNAFISEDATKAAIETYNNLNLLDLKNDQFWKLSSDVKKIIFDSEPIVYINNGKNISYLAYFKNGEMTKIRDLGILNPQFAVLKDSLLIYEKNSPVFSLNLNKPDQLSIFLPAKENYDLLVNKNKDLIFVNFKENNNWQSEIIDLNKTTKYSFPWSTIQEKCSFDDVLVCAFSPNLDPENWRMFQPVFDQKIIIYNPKNNESKEINLEAQFDIVKPKLTPLGVIFWNRLDAKFYLLKVD